MHHIAKGGCCDCNPIYFSSLLFNVPSPTLNNSYLQSINSFNDANILIKNDKKIIIFVEEKTIILRKKNRYQKR